MFRRLDKQLPIDPAYPADLDKLGFVLNQQLQFVAKERPVEEVPPSDTDDTTPAQHVQQPSSEQECSTRFFDFFHTSSDRANEVRKEAMHACARQIVLEELQKTGVREVFLSGDDGSTVTEDRPNGPHVSILISGRIEDLRAKTQVLLVIGEACQDLGIWAYRILMRQGGVAEGTAVKLAREILIKGRLESEQLSISRSQELEPLIGVTKKQTPEDDSTVHESAPATALVILNPGQLLYSHSTNRSMTAATWLARPRPSAVSDPHKIDDTHNRVAGHRTSSEHIQTCLALMPVLFQAALNLYVVGISESAEELLKFLEVHLRCDKRSSEDGSWYDQNIMAIAMCQPTHRPTQLHNPALLDLLAKKGMSWVIDDKEKDSVIDKPASAIARAAKIEYAPGFDASGKQTGSCTSRTGQEHDHDMEIGKGEDGGDMPEPVSCTTKSAGPEIDVAECVWPAVMDSVLDFFVETARAKWET